MSEMQTEETWKDVVGYEGLYQVSDMGRVKRVAHYRGNHHNSLAWVQELLLKPSSSNGYQMVQLSKDGRKRPHLVHALVMRAFEGPMPEGLQCVMHRNDIKHDNRLSNLKYGTFKENTQDAKAKGRLISVWPQSARIRTSELRSIPILATNIDTGEEIPFKNAWQAAAQLGISQGNIYSVCSGQRKRAGRYSFKKVTT